MTRTELNKQGLKEIKRIATNLGINIESLRANCENALQFKETLIEMIISEVEAIAEIDNQKAKEEYDAKYGTSFAKNNQKEIVFLMGLPASGKSTKGKEVFETTHQFIDCDEIKKTHPEYNPKEAFKIHDWSKMEEEKMWLHALTTNSDYVLDGTGVNAEKMVRRINQAKVMGFSTKLFYVTCTLETSIRRALKRERQVPIEMIQEKALNIATSFEIVSKYVDAIQVVDNDTDTK